MYTEHIDIYDKSDDSHTFVKEVKIPKYDEEMEDLKDRFKSEYDMLIRMDRIVECVNELREAEETLEVLRKKDAEGRCTQKERQAIIELEIEASRWKEWMMYESKELENRRWTEHKAPYATHEKVAYACYVKREVKGL